MTEARLALERRLSSYRRKALVLRQINSDSLTRFQRLRFWSTWFGILLTAILAVLAFIGTARIRTYLWQSASEQAIELTIAGLAFVVFVGTILIGLLGFDERISRSFRSIVVLSQFIADIDDCIGHDLPTCPDTSAVLAQFRERYKTIIEVLPPNTDRQYLNARKNLQEKSSGHDAPAGTGSEAELSEQLTTLLLAEDWRREILLAIRAVDPDLWVGGGFVRSAVWNDAHEFPDSSSDDDVDVVYFDKAANREMDRSIEAELRSRLPNVRWEVKNQSRMNRHSGDPAYTSLEDAVSAWPEVCTAVLVHLQDDDSMDVLAPFGSNDLFNLIVRPTPVFGARHPDAYLARIRSKKWHDRWPDLAIVYPTSVIKRFRLIRTK